MTETFLPNVAVGTWLFPVVVSMYLKDIFVLIVLAAAFPLVNVVRGLTGNLNRANPK